MDVPPIQGLDSWNQKSHISKEVLSNQDPLPSFTKIICCCNAGPSSPYLASADLQGRWCLGSKKGNHH